MYNAKEIIVRTFCAAKNSEVCLKFLKTAMIEKERPQKNPEETIYMWCPLKAL